MPDGSSVLAPEVTLLAHASAYGGVATHLNQFASALLGMVRVRRVFLFTNTDIELNREGSIPSPKMLPTLNRLWETKRLLKKFIVPLNFIRELWLGVLYRDYFLKRHLVIVSHDPNAFWGLTLLAGQVDYFLFVLPDETGEHRQPGERIIKRIVVRLWRTFLHRLARHRISNNSIRLIAPTKYAADIWASFLGLATTAIHTIPNPPFLARQCDGIIRDNQASVALTRTIAEMAGKGFKLVLSVGHLEDYKNPRRWLELSKFAHECDETLVFVWVGDGSLFEEISKAASGFPRIFLTGRLNQSDLKRLYEASWVFFHPAIKESQGIVVMDALTQGLPVILNESEALPGLIENTGAGITLNCASLGAASEYISILERLREETCYQQISQQAKSLANRRYSYEKWLVELQTLFLEHKTFSGSTPRNDGQES